MGLIFGGFLSAIAGSKNTFNHGTSKYSLFENVMLPKHCNCAGLRSSHYQNSVLFSQREKGCYRPMHSFITNPPYYVPATLGLKGTIWDLNNFIRVPV